MTSSCARQTVAKIEAMRLTASAMVKFPIGFEFRKNTMRVVTKAAMPVLTTVSTVLPKLLLTVCMMFPFVCSLLWTCLQTTMPVLMVAFIASMTFVTLGRASAVFTVDTMVRTRTMPMMIVVEVKILNSLQSVMTQFMILTALIAVVTPFVLTSLRFSLGLTACLLKNATLVGRVFVCSSMVSRAEELMLTELETRFELAATVRWTIGVETIRPLSMTVKGRLTPVEAQVLNCPVFEGPN